MQWELFRWIYTLHRHDWRNDKPERPAQAAIIVKVSLSKRNSALPKMMNAYGRDPCADVWTKIVWQFCQMEFSTTLHCWLICKYCLLLCISIGKSCTKPYHSKVWRSLSSLSFADMTIFFLDHTLQYHGHVLWWHVPFHTSCVCCRPAFRIILPSIKTTVHKARKNYNTAAKARTKISITYSHTPITKAK